MICKDCGYDDKGTGDFSHGCSKQSVLTPGDGRALRDRVIHLISLVMGKSRGDVEVHHELIELIDSMAVAIDSPPAQPAPSVPDVPAKSLKPVIDWLRNGCDPLRAADEIELLIAAAPEANNE